MPPPGTGDRLYVPVSGTALLNWEDQWGGGDKSYGNDYCEIVFAGDGTATIKFIRGTGAYYNDFGVGGVHLVGRILGEYGPVAIPPPLPEVGQELVVQIFAQSGAHTYISGPASGNPDNFAHAALSWEGTPEYYDVFPLAPDYPIRRRLLDRKVRTPLQNGNLDVRTEGLDLSILEIEGLAGHDELDTLFEFYDDHADEPIYFDDAAFSPAIRRVVKFVAGPDWEEVDNATVRWRCTLQEVPA